MAPGAVRAGADVSGGVSAAQAIHPLLPLLPGRVPGDRPDMRMGGGSRNDRLAADLDVRRGALLDGGVRHHLRMPGYRERPSLRRVFGAGEDRNRAGPMGESGDAWRLHRDADRAWALIASLWRALFRGSGSRGGAAGFRACAGVGRKPIEGERGVFYAEWNYQRNPRNAGNCRRSREVGAGGILQIAKVKLREKYADRKSSI